MNDSVSCSKTNSLTSCDHEDQKKLIQELDANRNEATTGSIEESRPTYRDFSQAPIKPLQQKNILNKIPRHTRSSKFPTTLHQMLTLVDKYPEEYHIDGIGSFRPRDVLYWEHHGRSFVIVDKDKIVNFFLPKFFPLQKEYSSFQRQLNLYGFKRLKGENLNHVVVNKQIVGKYRYYHEMFLRTRPDMCRWIMRSKKPSNKTRQILEPTSEPDFESFPVLSARSGSDYDFLHFQDQDALSKGPIEVLRHDATRKSESVSAWSPTWNPRRYSSAVTLSAEKDCKIVPGKQIDYHEGLKRSNDCLVSEIPYDVIESQWGSSLKRHVNHQSSTWNVSSHEAKPETDPNIDRKVLGSYQQEYSQVTTMFGKQERSEQQMVDKPSQKLMFKVKNEISGRQLNDTIQYGHEQFSQGIPRNILDTIDFKRGMGGSAEQIESLEPNDVFNSATNLTGLEDFCRFVNPTRSFSKSGFVTSTRIHSQSQLEFRLYSSTPHNKSDSNGKERTKHKT